jgi:hypothetical protein
MDGVAAIDKTIIKNLGDEASVMTKKQACIHGKP